MLVDANIFQPLITVFAAVIKFFHDNVGLSWGWSIVLLTICVRLVLVPLTIKQFSSMRRMQHLQPQMKAIQQKYKEDKQRQQEEMMKFYRENDVNPLGSCLPLVAQLPVFISLFYMLRKNLRSDICPKIQTAFQANYAHVHNVSLKAAASQTVACGPHAPGAGFLFIKDITNTATGLTLVALLVLYVGTQLASTMLMSAPTMDKSQQRMMMLMPLIFVVFVIRFPAGLIVYWITTNAWTMAQQYTLKRLAGPPPAAPVVEATTAVTGPRRGGSGSGGNGAPTGGDDSGSGSASGGGLGGLLRGLGPRASATNGEGSKQREAAPTPAGPPPRPPRKKKKRSGRRR
ncbi:MAG TPA: YidC/Oxa1 family membrane protein insertase [Solirubrobacteraceae bacterium]|jgi:YidC/Oxa1 family membrane protein insertase|nr:YidC/Oxa1 family membrane protein insertase [Solirubrobacteraceae bacterium]